MRDEHTTKHLGGKSKCSRPLETKSEYTNEGRRAFNMIRFPRGDYWLYREEEEHIKILTG